MSADIETDFETWARLQAELELLPDEASRARFLDRAGVGSRWTSADQLWRAQLQQDHRVGEARRAQRLDQLRREAWQRAQRSLAEPAPSPKRTSLEPNVQLGNTAPVTGPAAAQPPLPFAGRRASPMPAHPLEPNPSMGATVPLRPRVEPQPPPRVVAAQAAPADPPPAPRPPAPPPKPPPRDEEKPPAPPKPSKPPPPEEAPLDPDSARVAASLKNAGADPKALAALTRAMRPPTKK